MRRTKEEIKMKFRGKDIIIPKGTATIMKRHAVLIRTTILYVNSAG